MRKNFKIIAIIMLLMFLVFFVSCGEKKSNDKNLEITSIGDSKKTADITEEEQEKVITMDNYSNYEEALKANWYCINEYVITDIKVGKLEGYFADYFENNTNYITDEEFEELLNTNEYRSDYTYRDKYYNPLNIKYVDFYRYKVGQKVLDCHRNKWNIYNCFIFDDEDMLLWREYNINPNQPRDVYDTAQTIEEVTEGATFLGFTQPVKVRFDGIVYNEYDLQYNSEGGCSKIEAMIKMHYEKDGELCQYYILLTLMKNVEND